MSLQSLSLFQWLHESNKHYTKFHQRFSAKFSTLKREKRPLFIQKEGKSHATQVAGVNCFDLELDWTPVVVTGGEVAAT